ncbi:1, 4-beta cellobiohydrolase [Pelagophyceae sp. CCMP2097]|nr:1, 4-beta cellobiohydrolase [Pelagophyceae sp. CCMP2097]
MDSPPSRAAVRQGPAVTVAVPQNPKPKKSKAAAPPAACRGWFAAVVLLLCCLLIGILIAILVLLSMGAFRSGGRCSKGSSSSADDDGAPTMRPTPAGGAAPASFCCFYSPSEDLRGKLRRSVVRRRKRRLVSVSVSQADAAADGARCPVFGSSLDNLFAASKSFYVNPTYAVNLETSIATADSATIAATLEKMKSVASAYWIDVKSKIELESTSGLRGILLDASRQSPPPLCVFIVYDLPNRDCHAKASNGEICCTYNDDGTCDYEVFGSSCTEGLKEYRTQFIDPFAAVLAEFDGIVPVALVIEPDSLPNFVTNSDEGRCGNPATRAAYYEGIRYAVTTIAAKTDHVSMYLDAAHGAWLGWDDNLAGFASAVAELGIEKHLRGVATNVANYQPLGEPCPVHMPASMTGGVDCIEGPGQSSPCCDDPCGLLGEYNRANNEYNYARHLVAAFKAKMPSWDPHVIIDTGRNGNPEDRPDCATWCNPRDMGVGHVPTSETLPGIVDAIYWLKTPGESDGCSEELPSGDACPRFDSNCASAGSLGTKSGEPRAPQAGHCNDCDDRGQEAPGNNLTIWLYILIVVWDHRQHGLGRRWFYNAAVVDALVDDWGVTVLRCAMGVEDDGGYIDDNSGNRARVVAVVEAAIDRGIYVIIDWHSHHAEDYLEEANAFFAEMAGRFGGHDNVIFEVYNEPMWTEWPTIRAYSEAVTATIRAASSNLVLVSTRVWSQEVDVAARDPVSDGNSAYVLHFSAATHAAALRDSAEAALDLGAALFVSQWTTNLASGDGGVDAASTAEWMAFFDARGISSCNWAVDDKDEGASALCPGASTSGAWSTADYSASGLAVRAILLGE